MTEENRLDLEYTALKMKTGLRSDSVNQLINMGVINSHRDLTVDTFAHVVKKASSEAISKRLYNNLIKVQSKLDGCKEMADYYESKAIANGVNIVSVLDDSYPYVWRHLENMPKVVFAMGDVDLLKDTFTSGTAAIVGSRHPGRYASYATKDFTEALTAKGVIIVSGMALGIDGEAHRCALNNGGKTIGITPGGPDVIYPYQHSDLYKDMYANGLILSEMPPGQNINKQYFPARNRLISALSDACLIMEAGKYSGTLHTASYAGAQGKELFVLPNSIYTENGLGGLMLIRDGAEVLLDSQTVLDRIKNIVLQRVKEDGVNYPELLLRKGDLSVVNVDPLDKMKQSPDKMTQEEWRQATLALIEEKPRNFDELSALIKLDNSLLLAILTELEVTGEVDMDRDRYVLTIQKT